MTLRTSLSGGARLALHIPELTLAHYFLIINYVKRAGNVKPRLSQLLSAGDMGMPSSMPQSQNGNDMAAASGLGGAAAGGAVSDQAAVAPRFQAGSRVLYDSDGVPVKGTVAKPNATGQSSQNMQVAQLSVGLANAHSGSISAAFAMQCSSALHSHPPVMSVISLLYNNNLAVWSVTRHAGHWLMWRV